MGRRPEPAIFIRGARFSWDDLVEVWEELQLADEFIVETRCHPHYEISVYHGPCPTFQDALAELHRQLSSPAHFGDDDRPSFHIHGLFPAGDNG